MYCLSGHTNYHMSTVCVDTGTHAYFTAATVTNAPHAAIELLSV